MPAWTVSKWKSHHAQLITVQLIAEAQTCTRTRVCMTKQGKPSVKLGSSKNEHAQTSQKKKHTKPFLAHSSGCFVGFFLFVGDLVCAIPTAKTPAILLDSAPEGTQDKLGSLAPPRKPIQDTKRGSVDLSGSTDDLTHSIIAGNRPETRRILQVQRRRQNWIPKNHPVFLLRQLNNVATRWAQELLALTQ